LKKFTFNIALSDSSEYNKFSGFKSRWTTFWECRY